MEISRDTKILVQGITGKEGRRAVKSMIEYGTKVVCGVTPGKSEETVEGLPVYDSVKEALSSQAKIDASVIYVPPLQVYDAALEAIENNIGLIFIITENVPIQDTSKIVEMAKQKNIRIIGPSSIGLIIPEELKIGSIENDRAYTKGNVAIMSKSGGMCSETSLLLTKNGIGQSIVIGLGGDIISGTTFAEMLEILDNHEETKAIVLYGEIGGKYEEIAADIINKGKIKKPVVAFIAGKFAESLNRNLAIGHTGAIIGSKKETADEKKKILKESGVLIANYHHEIVGLIKTALEKNE